MTGSRMLKLPEARSILARRASAPRGTRRSASAQTGRGSPHAVAVGPGRRGTELLRRQLADVGQALLEEPVAPVKAQPVDILLDGVHILGVLLGGVGVVHAQVAQAAEALGGAEVDGQRLAVADVQIAVGLRRKTGVDLRSAPDHAKMVAMGLVEVFSPFRYL